MTLSLTFLARADFQPITLTTDSYNQDMVVENSAPPAVVPVTTASMDTGISNSGYSWFERGYFTDYPATGLPEAGSLLTSDEASDHHYQLPLSYKTTNAVLIDSILNRASLTFTTPTNYAALSLLTSSGVTDNFIQYKIRYEDGTSETGTFTSFNWFSNYKPAWSANGRIDVRSFAHDSLNSYNPKLYSVDLALSNSASPIVGVDLSHALGIGHTAIFAISGASVPGAAFAPITFSGFNEDLVVEATAIKPGFLDYNTTATMDNGTANTRFTWYEMGYYPVAPDTGLPAPGSSLTSETAADHHFLMPPSYTNANAILIDAVYRSSVLTLATPQSYSALSFLTASGHGPVTNRCVINHRDGSSETNRFVSPDWLDNSTPAFTANGRVSVNTRVPDRVNANSPRLYAADVPITNSTSPVTSIVLTLAGAGYDAHAVVFAISGNAAAGPPKIRPSLSIAAADNGTLTIRSTQPGNLQSAKILSGSDAVWKNEGVISTQVSLTISPGEPFRFYRVVAQ